MRIQGRPIMLAAAALSLVGCSTIQPMTQKVSIRCSEADAVLDVNGTKYRGHAELDARRNKDLLLSCAKPGFHTSTRTIRTSLSGTGIADAIGGFLVLAPAVGLVTPGAWNLDETDITIPMQSETP